MEVRVRERLIGALVLVAVVVLLVPAILKGRAPAPAPAPGQQMRRVEVPVGNEAVPPREQAASPAAEPQLPPAAPRPVGKPPEPAPAAKAPPEPTTASAAPPASERSAATDSAWAVQVAAYASRDKANQLVAELQKRRYAAFVLEYRASGKVLYRVRVGPEQDRQRAEEIAARLTKDGFQPVVARHP